MCGKNSDVTGQIVIPRRFNGPPDSANGGFACGAVARSIEGSAEVTLRRPPPLDRPLRVSWEGEKLLLHDEDALIAEARAIELDLEVPAPVGFDVARIASERFRWHHDHPFPTCFVCGPRRAEGDGLRIFPGEVEGSAIVAAPWIPDRSIIGEDGNVLSEVVWGALDCTTSFGAGLAGEAGPSVIGQLAAKLERPVEPGARHVALGWPLGVDGRKWLGGSAVFNETGELCAYARGLWIELRRPLGG